MAKSKAKAVNFSITKSPKPAITQSVAALIVSDGLFILLVFLMIGIRNALGLTTTLAMLIFAIFVVKAIITTVGIYMILRNWLGISYYVMDGQLVIKSSIKQAMSSTRNLRELRNVQAGNKYFGSYEQKYGNVVLEFSTGASKENITLRGVENPELVGKRLMDHSIHAH